MNTPSSQPGPLPRPTLSTMVPYTPGRSVQDVQAEFGVSEVVKLASNENPFGSPITPEELATAIVETAVYPHLASAPVLSALASQFGISTTQIVIGNGSDELLTLIGLAYLNPGDGVITASGTFSEYRFVANLMDAALTECPMTPDWQYDLTAIAEAVTANTKLIFIANPNNPTGLIVGADALSQLMVRVPSHVLVVIDEAYAEFVDDPTYPNTVDWIARYPNLLVTRTFSKLYGLAGYRIGYAMGSPAVIAALYKVRQPFNVNSVALTAANLALGKVDYIQRTLLNNTVQRTRLTQALTALGRVVLPSHANFVCVRWGEDAGDVVMACMRQGVIVRHLASFGMPDFIRITVGTPAQNDRVLAVLTPFRPKN